MNIVMIIPTGIGCEIGGHAGDANPIAKLLASVSDNLILHPNVVNASDINEMPDNALYVEGSMLDRFLEGKIELKKVYKNKILLAVNSPVTVDTINSVNAARVTLGADIEIVELTTPLTMTAKMVDGTASGSVDGIEGLISQVSMHNFDALAIATPINVDRETADHYLNNGGVNPWGGVEAIASRLISQQLNKPVAHSPIDDKTSAVYDLMLNFGKPVDPRMSAELVSVSYLHCILKGLHKAPRIGKGLSVEDIDVMVSPYGCEGPAHRACNEAGISVIVVKENKTIYETYLNIPRPKANYIFVENYLEAVGLIQSWKVGVSTDSVRRRIGEVTIHHK